MAEPKYAKNSKVYVRRDDLMELLWPGVVVKVVENEGSIKYTVKMCGDHTPQIVTVPEAQVMAATQETLLMYLNLGVDFSVSFLTALIELLSITEKEEEEHDEEQDEGQDEKQDVEHDEKQDEEHDDEQDKEKDEEQDEGQNENQDIQSRDINDEWEIPPIQLPDENVQNYGIIWRATRIILQIAYRVIVMHNGIIYGWER